eukprot:snap_masked-scaffold221_size251850-processed-gene-1.8 protein:Tk12505 transcript:snap_masked-scaffold221_size251850-processed-gene-1.8-mRNA-1 annotation:"hypothetical protein SINV_00302"
MEVTIGGTGSTNRNGTCFTATECVSKSGTAAGSCAAGFGVCCVFLVSSGGATINQNCTYIRNPNFPNAYDSTSQVAYTIRKCDPRVCQLRLDFESFSIQGTGNIEETDTVRDTIGGVCLDMFKVTTNTGSPIPTICGQNTGQHMYIDLGCERSDTATLSFDFDGSDNNRLWEIKVSQIKCNTEGHPNGCGCLQYHTGLTGRFTSFNFLPTNDNHLANQEYAICIRQEEGMCCIEYTPCADTNSYSFNAIEADPDDGTAKQDTDCATFDYIGIEGVQATCSTSSGNIQNSRLCGQKFNVIKEAIFDAASLCDCSKPFQVDIFFNGMTDLAADEPNEGQSRGLGTCSTADSVVYQGVCSEEKM